MSETRDKYDLAIEYLTEHPEHIHKSWMVPSIHPRGGCLFRYCTASAMPEYIDGKTCGCLTLIRYGGFIAATPELTAEIKNDERLPKEGRDIRPEHLPAFAEWQRRLDRELNRA